MTNLSIVFASDHPCGPGHFPGNPIIPGALLLSEVLTRIANDLAADNIVWNIKSAKFPQPVRPGDDVHISYRPGAEREISFDCRVHERKVLSGTASYRTADGNKGKAS